MNKVCYLSTIYRNCANILLLLPTKWSITLVCTFCEHQKCENYYPPFFPCKLATADGDKKYI